MHNIKRLNPYTRKRLLELVQVEKFKVKDACNVLGVSEFTYYYWKKRQSFRDLPTIPTRFYRKTPKELAILQNINAFPVQRNSGIFHFQE